ncbi:MAG TPA: hypothetical protein VNX86_03900 [Rhizomicrobium sp.]|jgi:hypothetical protein|nr:hypothetical protein [Rhizomicrobium sp.]
MTRLRFRERVSVRDVNEVTNKTLIATFNGDNIVAEREGGELKIYLIGTGDIGEVQTRVRTIQDWQRVLDRAHNRKPAA